MLPWGETRAISKSLLSFCLFCLKRSLVKKATLPISSLTTCTFFCFYWENVAKKKKLCFCHLPNSVKRSVVFFEAKQFLDKNRKQGLTNSSCFFFVAFVLTPNLNLVLFNKKNQNNLPLKTLFFLANEKTKRKKNFIFVSETNVLWFLFERKSECWAAVVIGKLF